MSVRQIRHGDVLLTAVEAPDAPVRATDASGQPLAGVRIPGERSGHMHVLPARVYDAGSKRLLFLERPELMRVVRTDNPEVEFVRADGRPRHPAVEVPAGWWELTPQRQYAPRRRPVSRARYD